jgi:hypothetical protein
VPSEKSRTVTTNQGKEEYLTNNKKEKANWIGHNWRRNRFLKHVIEGKI